MRAPGAADDIAVRAGGGRRLTRLARPGAARRSCTSMTAATYRPPAHRRRRQGCRSGERRPTTTASAGWPRPGRRSASTDSNGGCCLARPRADGRVTTVDEVTTGCGAPSATSGGDDVGSGGYPGRGGCHRAGRARRCRAGRHRARGVPGLETFEWFGRGPHETYPDRKRGGLIGRWRSTVHRADRAVHPPAGERWSRRRPLARAAADDGRADAWSFDRPMQVVGDAPPRRGARGGDASRGAGERRRDDRPSRRRPPRPRDGSCGPDTLPAYLVGPGTYRWSWTMPCVERSRHDDRMAARRSPVPPPQRPLSMVLRVYEDGSPRRSPPRCAARRRAGRTGTSDRTRSRASGIGSATRSRSSTRQADR